MSLKLIIPAIAVVIALGVSLATVSSDAPNQNSDDVQLEVIQREKINDFSHFPQPTLPSTQILEKTLSTSEIQTKDHIKNIGDGYELTHVIEDPYYGETTLFYSTPNISQIVTNEDNIQGLISKGMIVFDYERIDNLSERISGDEILFRTVNDNPVYADNGLNGEYLRIAYSDEGISLSIYGNGEINLRELIKSLDL